MKYAFDTNIYQLWRNINDPSIQKVSKHNTILTIKQCFLDVENGVPLIIPRIILTEHLVWVAKIEGVDAALDVLDMIIVSPWQVIYEHEEIHKEAMAIGSRYGGLGAADLLLAAIAKQENATIVTMDLDFRRLKSEIDVILLESIVDLI
ncbi:MAG: PIN domain-containing protein [Methanosarcinales archaeon]|nr:PIN domain-containing protein [Methanosarcinales archaeon]